MRRPPVTTTLRASESISKYGNICSTFSDLLTPVRRFFSMASNKLSAHVFVPISWNGPVSCTNQTSNGIIISSINFAQAHPSKSEKTWDWRPMSPSSTTYDRVDLIRLLSLVSMMRRSSGRLRMLSRPLASELTNSGRFSDSWLLSCISGISLLPACGTTRILSIRSRRYSSRRDSLGSRLSSLRGGQSRNRSLLARRRSQPL